MNLKKNLALVAALAMSATVLAGCTKTEGNTPADTTAAGGDTPATTDAAAPEDTGDQLTVMSWNDEVPVKWGETVYTAAKPLPDGVTYNPVVFGVGGGEATPYFQNYMESGDDLDVFALEADFALTFLNSSYAGALADVGISEDEFANAYDYTMAIGTVDGVLKAVSMQASPGVYAYRTDLADQYLGVKSPDEMQAKVKDWDTYLATAEEVKQASGGKCTMSVALGGIWQVFSAARTQDWVVDNKFVVTDEVKEFLELSKTLADNGYIDTNAQTWDASWYGRGIDGTTMGMFTTTWGLEGCILIDAAGGVDGPSYGLWNITTGPAGWYWGGTWLAVSSTTDNPNLAADFIRYFCADTETMTHFARETGTFVNNKEAVKNIVAEGGYKNPLLGGQDSYAFFAPAADVVPAMNIGEYDGTVKSALNPVMVDYATGKYASIDDAVKAFTDNVQAALPDLAW